MVQKIKYHEKVKVCTMIMQNTEATLAEICNKIPNIANDVDRTRFGARLKNLVNELRDTRLKVQPVRQVLSMEDRSRRRLLKIHEKHVAKTLSWLRTDGIKKGANGQRRKDGAKVVFCCDPFISYEGIRISVHYTDSNERNDNVDPMQFMPDLTVPAVSPTKRPTPIRATARKAAPAKSSAAK